MAERRVSWNINARIDRFEKNLKTAERRMMRFSRQMSNIGRGFTTHVTMPAMAAAGALLGLTHQAASYADEIDKASIRSGVARDSLQELRFVGDQLGVTFTGMTSVMESFTRRIPQIREGTGRSAEAFAQLGVHLEDSQGNMRSMNDLFPDLIRGLSGIRNETERNAIGTQIFGRRFFEIVPMLEAGGDEIERLMRRSRELGLVMGDDAIADLVAFKDEWSEVQQQLKMAGMEIGREVMPLLRDELIPFISNTAVPAVREFANWIRNLDDSTKRNIVRWTAYAAAIGPVMIGMSSMARFLVNMNALLRMQIGLVRTLTAAMMANPWLAAAAAIGMVVVQLRRAERQARETRDMIRSALDLEPTGTQAELELVNEAIKEQVRIIRELEDRYARTFALTEEDARRREQRLDAEMQKLVQNVRKRAEIVQMLKEEADAVGDVNVEVDKLLSTMSDEIDERETLSSRMRENRERIDELINKTDELTEAEERQIAALGRANHELERQIANRERLAGVAVKPFIAEEFEDTFGDDETLEIDFDVSPAVGSIAYLEEQVRAMNEQIRHTTDDTWRDNLITIRNATQEQIEMLQGVEEQMQETGASMADWAGIAVQAFDRLNFQGEKFSSVLKSIGRQLATRGMMALLTGGTGGLGMLFGGGALSAFGGMFATGGRLPAGQWGIAGEAGPEVITGPANITPMKQIPASAGVSSPALSIENNMYLDGRLVWRNQREVQYGKGR